MAESPPVAELRKVRKGYRRGTVQIQVLRDLDLVVQRGDWIAVVGPSGCGKSTLLHILGTLDAPESGSVLLAGQDVSLLNDERLSRLRNAAIGFVFQSYNLLPGLTALENVALPLRYQSVPPARRRQRALAALAAVGLAERAHHRPAQLSGGEEQRVAIARAMVTGPDLILADEPTGNLDTASSEAVMGQLAQVNEKGVSLVVVTHDPAVAAMARTVLVLADGALRPT